MTTRLIKGSLRSYGLGIWLSKVKKSWSINQISKKFKETLPWISRNLTSHDDSLWNSLESITYLMAKWDSCQSILLLLGHLWNFTGECSAGLNSYLLSLVTVAKLAIWVLVPSKMKYKVYNPKIPLKNWLTLMI